MSKEKIIHAAMEVFSEHGYHRASMDEIALRAQVAKGTLYYNFPGKAQLFKTIVKQALQDIINHTCQNLDNTTLSIEEQIRYIIRHNLDVMLESRNVAHIIFNELSNGIEQEVLDEIKDLRREYLGFITELLEEGKRSGYIVNVLPMVAASGVIGMLQSACNYYLTNPDSMTREDLEQSLFVMITKGLLSHS
ncbi:TetR/AcrR family transcriptional regulator [Paenibacillus sp. 1001270B_150601_E10]|uniref:TetR/AcrR family transcriptional regulator n=1 Tax=Paenibacillus sp. 1001270B_150601_E10 TaxID=2787079 RepID=UPI00189D51CB|nr:TetR/AcrR family transcriptional regulator [Paenibacillus sp. 1001270B_150601_E10]